MSEQPWTKLGPFDMPVEGVPVETKIDDDSGVRNEQRLVRRGKLWFFTDESMYVYYTPTHWRRIQ